MVGLCLASQCWPQKKHREILLEHDQNRHVLVAGSLAFTPRWRDMNEQPPKLHQKASNSLFPAWAQRAPPSMHRWDNGLGYPSQATAGSNGPVATKQTSSRTVESCRAGPAGVGYLCTGKCSGQWAGTMLFCHMHMCMFVLGGGMPDGGVDTSFMHSPDMRSMRAAFTIRPCRLCSEGGG